MAVAILVLSWVRGQGYLKHVVSMEHYHLMGKLLLAFTIFWAYIGFDQFFLIWYANLPDETWGVFLRFEEPWRALGFTVFGFVFLLPFAFMPNLNQVTLMQLDGMFSLEEFKQAISMAKDAGMKVYKLQREALLKKYFAGGGPESTTRAEMMEEA